MKLCGNPVSPGVAVGRLYLYRPAGVEVLERPFGPQGPQGELRRMEQVLAEAGRELEEIVRSMEAEDPGRAKIFAAHQDILLDETLVQEAMDAVREKGWAGDWALKVTLDRFAAVLDQVPDPLIRERAADLRDVCARILRIWHGGPRQGLSQLPGPVVVAARDLLPSDTATLDRSKVLAILTEAGGATSHSAIIARSYGIPAVQGISGLLAAAEGRQTAAVDALTGQVLLDPAPEAAAHFRERAAACRAQAAALRDYRDAQPLTADGVRIDIGLNLGAVSQEELEAADCADFVGLLRTEFLYLGTAVLPGEERQYQAYKRVLEHFGERPVCLRTLDIGGDKQLESLPLPAEENPFLGNRGLRLCLSRPELFRVQLRAALRASVHGNLWLMLPMVSGIEEIRRARALIREVHSELKDQGVPVAADYKVGIMIETPAIAAVADLAAGEVDFASLGTNDLCQYLTASDRLNPAAAPYHQTLHPGMLRTVAGVADAFRAAGKPLSVCGEMAGDPRCAALLVGLGLRKLSMSPGRVAVVKKQLRALALAQAEALAAAAKELPTAAEVERCLREALDPSCR